MGTTFSPMVWPSGQNNMGGYQNHVLFYPEDYFTAEPAIGVVVDLDDNVTATGAFTMVTGLKPIYVYATPNTVNFQSDSQGETDGKSFVQKGEFFHPGNTKAVHAFASMIKNTPGRLVLVDSDGNQQLVGSEGHPVSIVAAFTGGKAAADQRGFKFEFSSDSNLSAVFLETPIDFSAIKNGTTVVTP